MNTELTKRQLEILLTELHDHPADYLALLSTEEKIAFINAWDNLCSDAAPVTFAELSSKVFDTLKQFPALSKELVGDDPLTARSRQRRFNPEEKKNKDKHDTVVPSSVVILIKNEVIKVKDAIRAVQDNSKTVKGK